MMPLSVEWLNFEGLKHHYGSYVYEGTEYERKRINRVLPMDDAVWDNYLKLSKELADAQKAVWDIMQKVDNAGLYSYSTCCSEEICPPECEVETEWLETEEEWIARCKELDADKA